MPRLFWAGAFSTTLRGIVLAMASAAAARYAPLFVEPAPAGFMPAQLTYRGVPPPPPPPSAPSPDRSTIAKAFEGPPAVDEASFTRKPDVDGREADSHYHDPPYVIGVTCGPNFGVVTMAQSNDFDTLQHVTIAAAQQKTDLVRAESILQDAFATDVRPAIRDWRAARGRPIRWTPSARAATSNASPPNARPATPRRRRGTRDEYAQSAPRDSKKIRHEGTKTRRRSIGI